MSLEETHVFSPTLLNTARFGFSRAGYYFTGEPTPGTPAASVPGFLSGLPVGAVVVGGSAASNPQAQIGLAGSNNGSNLPIERNIFTYEDRVTLTRGHHQLSFGAWFQQFQSNEKIALSQYGQATFASLAQFINTGVTSTFLYDPAPTNMNWRSFFSAFYAEDVFRFRPNLTLSLGFRGEFSTGWNEAHGHAANYTYPGGIISSEPHIGDSFFTVNNAKFLPQPRVALAWSPFGPKTVVRAGFGMYNDLQDALGYRADQNAPFNPVYSLASYAVSNFPIDPAAPVPAAAKLVPGGVQPDMQTPTLISWSLRVERELSPNTVLDRRLRRLARLSRTDRHRRQRTNSRDLSGVALPGSLSNLGSQPADKSHEFTDDWVPDWFAAGRRSRSRRHLLHSRGHAESESRDCQYLDMVF